MNCFMKCFLLAIDLLLIAVATASAADTNSLVWRTAADRVSAELHGEPLWPLLEDIAHQTGWHIFVEPATERNASVKFTDLPSGNALKFLLGDLNFALVPQTNGPTHLYIFRTTMQNATKPVDLPKPAKRIANELLVKVKPGTNMDALAKLLGARVTGRLDKLGLYLLEFTDLGATEAALAQLQGKGDVAQADYNYSFDPPPGPVPLLAAAGAHGGPVSLTLNPPGDSGKVVVGLIDMSVQSLGPQLDKFILPQQSVIDGDLTLSDGMTHGTAMAYTILSAISQQGGSTSVQILPVDVYGGDETTTSWNVALGIQKAVDGGANVLNMSLGSSGDSAVLDGVIKLALADNIVIFGAAGNTPVRTPTFPGAIPGVQDVTALGAPGKLAPYANNWPGNNLALPGTSIVYFGNQAYGVQGTSTATANASGVFAGTMSANGASPSQILGAMQAKFPVPKK